MAELFASGRIVDAILALIVVEAMLLTVLHRRFGVGMPPTDLAGYLVSGAALLLALRSALVGSPWTTTASWLAVALVAHLVDLVRRWR